MAPARDLKKLLADPSGDAVVELTGARAEEVEQAAAALGLYAASFTAAETADKMTLLASLARRLRFPTYFGHNWDALKDCLTDLQDLIPAPGWVIIVDADALSACEPGRFLEVMKEAAAFWRSQAPPRSLRLVLLR